MSQFFCDCEGSEQLLGTRFDKTVTRCEYFSGRHGGGEKRGGWKTSRMTPLPKRGFGPPSYGTFSIPLTCQCSVFPVQNQKFFWRGPKIFGRARSLVRFPPPIRLHPPISRPKYWETLEAENPGHREVRKYRQCCLEFHAQL